MTMHAGGVDDVDQPRDRVWEYDTPTGRPCPRTVRADGSIMGDGACHQCGLGPACPLFDPWAEGILD